MRWLLAFLSAPNLLNGAIALFAPQRWYTDFPFPGARWVEAFGSYNEHFIQDIGAAYLAFGVLFAVAAVRLERAWILASSLGFLVFAVPHLAIHLFVRAELSMTGYVVTNLLLGIGVVVALVTLSSTRSEEA